MQTLKLHIFEAGKTEPEIKITIPLSTLHISEKLLPKRIKDSLEKEGIELAELSGLFAKQGPRGTLIEIEQVKEKLVIMIE
jgi:hypothetical protein